MKSWEDLKKECLTTEKIAEIEKMALVDGHEECRGKVDELQRRIKELEEELEKLQELKKNFERIIQRTDT